MFKILLCFFHYYFSLASDSNKNKNTEKYNNELRIIEANLLKLNDQRKTLMQEIEKLKYSFHSETKKTCTAGAKLVNHKMCNTDSYSLSISQMRQNVGYINDSLLKNQYNLKKRIEIEKKLRDIERSIDEEKRKKENVKIFLLGCRH